MKRDWSKVYSRLGFLAGESPETVYSKIQKEIFSAFSNPATEEIAAFQQSVPKEGKFPTPDELIDFIFEQVEKEQ